MNASLPWQKAYMDAVLETDDSKLPQCVMAAGNAIQSHAMELAQDNQGTPEERQAVADAFNGLSILRKERLRLRGGHEEFFQSFDQGIR